MYDYDITPLANSIRDIGLAFQQPRRTPEQIAIETATARAQLTQQEAAAVMAERKLYEKPLGAERLGEIVSGWEANNGQVDMAEAAQWAFKNGQMDQLFNLNRGFEASFGQIGDAERMDNHIAAGGTIAPDSSFSQPGQEGTRAWLTRKAAKEAAAKARNAPLTESQWRAQHHRQNFGSYSPEKQNRALNFTNAPSLEQQQGPDGQTGYVNTNAFTPLFKPTRTTQGTADGGITLTNYPSVPVPDTATKLPAGVVTTAENGRRRGLNAQQAARKAELLNIANATDGVWPDPAMAEELQALDLIEQAFGSGLTVNEYQLFRSLQAISEGERARQRTPEEEQQFQLLLQKKVSNELAAAFGGGQQPAQQGFAAPPNARILD